MKEKATWFQKTRNETDKPDGVKDSSSSWRHKGGKEPQEEKKIDRGPPVTTLYVPATPKGELARRLQEADHRYSDLYQVGWTKMLERGGTK